MLFISFVNSEPILTLEIKEYGTIILYILIVAIGAALVRFGSNGMAGVIFIVYGMLGLLTSCASTICNLTLGRFDTSIFFLVMVLFLMIMFIVELLSFNKNKYAMASVLLLLSIKTICPVIITDMRLVTTVSSIICSIIVITSLYFALALISEKYTFPYSEQLKASDSSDFKECGSMTGYIIIGLVMLIDVLFDLGNLLPLGQVVAAKIVGGAILILIGLLLRSYGKMRYTPLLFLAIGVIILLGGIVANAYIGGEFIRSSGTFYVLGAGMIFLGVATLLRKDSRILLALLSIAIGICYVLYGVENVDVVAGVFALISVVLAIYLAIAVSSDRIKLPLI